MHVVKFSANDIDIQSNDWIKKDIFVLQSKNIESVSFEKITLTRSSGFIDSNKKDVETSSKNSVSSWNAQGLSNKKLSNNAAIEFIKKIADMRINGIASKQDVEKVDKSKKTKNIVFHPPPFTFFITYNYPVNVFKWKNEDWDQFKIIEEFRKLNLDKVMRL